MQRGKGQDAVIIVQETTDEGMRKKLKMLINKQYFELGKYMSDLYS